MTAIERSTQLMEGFAMRTGLIGDRPHERYLWTDAFAVCNFLGLAKVAHDERYVSLARRLVDRVHHVLGRHRPDDRRRGWISALPDAEGEQHPTCGGLRIGKPLPERRRGEPGDDELEWDRDGQYFHYLTKWMYALAQVSRASRDPRPHVWARELADVAHKAFVHGKRMYWKLSIDLAWPQVASMGQHDPLDGFVTCVELMATPSSGPDLGRALHDYRAMIDARPEALVTTDPLGVGGLLVDAARLARHPSEAKLTEAVAIAARAGLAHVARDLRGPADRRLGFRELGVAIGLAAVAAGPLAETFSEFQPLRGSLETFWWRHRHARTWTEHENINDVMLATSLVPAGFLGDSARGL